MRLRTVLSIAVFVALAACDSKGPPKVGATADQGAVTVPMTTAAAAPTASCPSVEEIIAKACPPAKVAKAPAKPVKVHRHPPKKKPRVQVAAAPPPEREYARVPPPAPQARITEEEVYQSWTTGGAAAPAVAPRPQMAFTAAGRDANGFLTWPGKR